MRYPTYKAAKLLNIHPANLIHYLASKGFSFDDVWPDVDKSLIDTIKGHSLEKSGNKKTVPKATDESNREYFEKMGISENAGLIVEKLYSNGKWNPASESFDSLQMITNLSLQELEESINELETKYFIIKHEEHNAYSLAPAKTSEIEHIIFSKHDS